MTYASSFDKIMISVWKGKASMKSTLIKLWFNLKKRFLFEINKENLRAALRPYGTQD